MEDCLHFAHLGLVFLLSCLSVLMLPPFFFIFVCISSFICLFHSFYFCAALIFFVLRFCLYFLLLSCSFFFSFLSCCVYINRHHINLQVLPKEIKMLLKACRAKWLRSRCFCRVFGTCLSRIWVETLAVLARGIMVSWFPNSNYRNAGIILLRDNFCFPPHRLNSSSFTAYSHTPLPPRCVD
jgi:hypothetical protein